ncbi:MAG TPA: peptide-methionine (R)-S-oxide reductase [Longilinea sp.]|nr:peptide-methionine (R)-S-oxide reductase [Longilinea sp.]
MQPNPLTREAEHVIAHTGTRAPFAGEHNDFSMKGTYVCRRCSKPLYRSFSKFNPGRGWLSFDQEIPGAVKCLPDQDDTYLQAIQRMGLWVGRYSNPDGVCAEIECAGCGAHLGHAVMGEGFASRNARRYVDSISLKFVPKNHE